MTASLAEAYGAALRDALMEGGGEAGLTAAYQLGRSALENGVSIIDIVLLHQATLAELIVDAPPDETRRRVDLAAAFLAESVSPFEMRLLGVSDANRQLIALNVELEQANAETRDANVALKAESDERQKMQEGLWQAQKLQATGRLAGGVAHHFNNLLTVVLGNLDFAARRVGDDEKLAGRLAAAIGAAERAAKVTQQLLSFSRRQILQPAAFDASTQLMDLVTLIGGSLSGTITVETDIPADLWQVTIDPTELELALLNLAINARDAMPQGGTLRIVAANRTLADQRLEIDGDYLVVEVTDTGGGIAPDVLPRVFEPFFTTKDVGVGTGLGLSQVHGFAHQSRGAVDIASEPGRGTTVRLYLPVTGGAAARPHETEVHHHHVAASVLVVDDDIAVAEIAASALEDCGFAVKVATSAKGALDVLGASVEIELVFSDILMPGGMNGIELAEEVLHRYPNLPVLLTTGYSDSLRKATDLGLAIVPKPYRSTELCERVTTLLGNR
ncbi:MAG TPA: ATP-binding protein [Caulobacter sp.]|nr:ATP-binding protein [Caulobacter sp.]